MLVCYRAKDTSKNGAVTRIGTKRGVAAHVRRCDRLLKPQPRCALHFVYCASCLHTLFLVFCRRLANCATEPPICCFCDLLACRSAYRTICSLVAEFALMVYGYRIILLRGRWPITFVIRGKTSSFILRLYAGVTGIAEILFDFSLFVIRRSLKKNRNTKANKV